MRITITLLLAVFISLSSCSEKEQTTSTETNPAVKVEINLDSSNVILTNQFSFNDGRYAMGGTSFILTSKKGAVLCTAKHLLGEAMGISPEVKTVDFNQSLDYWSAFAHNTEALEDTVQVRSIVNESPSGVDILLLNFKGDADNMLALSPRYSKVQPKEALRIIASEIGRNEPQFFDVVMDEYNKASFIVRAKKSFNPRAMSGSPVIDANGHVVGVLVGGGHFEGDLYLTVEPLSRVKKYLN
jgi:hypothetical protein